MRHLLFSPFGATFSAIKPSCVLAGIRFLPCSIDSLSSQSHLPYLIFSKQNHVFKYSAVYRSNILLYFPDGTPATARVFPEGIATMGHTLCTLKIKPSFFVQCYDTIDGRKL